MSVSTLNKDVEYRDEASTKLVDTTKFRRRKTYAPSISAVYMNAVISSSCKVSLTGRTADASASLSNKVKSENCLQGPRLERFSMHRHASYRRCVSELSRIPISFQEYGARQRATSDRGITGVRAERRRRIRTESTLGCILVHLLQPQNSVMSWS